MNWTDERIDDEVRAIGVPLSCDLRIIGLMRQMRDDLMTQLALCQAERMACLEKAISSNEMLLAALDKHKALVSWAKRAGRLLDKSINDSALSDKKLEGEIFYLLHDTPDEARS